MNTEATINVIFEEPPPHAAEIIPPAQEEAPSQDIPYQDTVNQGAGNESTAACEEEQQPGQEAVQVDPVRKDRLSALFISVINNPRFWVKENRVKRLEDALKLPIFDERALLQFSISARDELTREAMELAIKTQAVPVMPTEQEIIRRAEEKFKAKLAKESKKKLKKATN